MIRRNLVMLTGRACATPELKEARSSKVTTIRLAVNERIKKRDGEWEDKTVYIDCEAWGKRAEYVADKVSKGDIVSVMGKLEQDEWEAKDGSGTRQKHKVYICFDVQVDNYNSNNSGSNNSSGNQSGDSDNSSGAKSDLPF